MVTLIKNKSFDCVFK